MIHKITDKNYTLLCDYLNNVDEDFPIPLSEKVNLNDFAKKIIDAGIGFYYLDGEKLAGVILFYANNKETLTSYVSVLSVDENYRKQGIAQKLLNECINYCKKLEFKHIELYTHKTNTGAIKLYEKNGFVKYDDTSRPDDWFLRLDI